MEHDSRFQARVSRSIDRESSRKQMNPRNSLKTKVNSINRYIVFIISILGFILPWAFSHYTYEFYEITKNTVLILAVIILLLLWAIKITITKKLVIKKTPFDIPIIIYLSSKVLSTIFSIYKPTSIWGYYSRFTGGLISNIVLILLYYIVINNVSRKKDLYKILKVTIVSLILMAAFIIMKSFGVLNGIFDKLIESHPSLIYLNSGIFSPVGNPNVLPFLFIIALPVLMSFISGSDEDFTDQIIGIIGSCVCILVIGITSISGTNFIGIIVWVFVALIITIVFAMNMPLNQNVTFKFLPIIIFTIFSILFTFSSQFRDIISNDINFARYPDAPFNTSWSVIMGTYKEHKIQGFLIGTGLDTYAYNFTRFRPIEQNLEPNWNQNYTKSSREIFGLLSESGLFGLLSFILFAFVVSAFILKNIIKKDISGDYKIVGIGFALLSVFIISFLTSYSVTMLFMFWLLLASLVSAYFAENERNQERYEISLNVSKSKIAIENEKDVVPYFLLGISVIIIGLSTFITVKNYIAELQYKKSLVAISWGELGNANDFVIKSINKNDKRDYYHRQLAYVALQALNDTLDQDSSQEQDQQRIQAYQNYLISLINEETNNAISLNKWDAVNWEVSAVIYKQLVEITNGKMYGDETLYASSKAIELNPYNPDNYIILGYIYQFNTNEELSSQAERVFKQAYSLQPSYVLSIFSLGNYLEFSGKYDEAVNLYTISINNYYPYESDVNSLLEERKLGAISKKEGEALEEDVVPSDEDITEELEENILPGSE